MKTFLLLLACMLSLSGCAASHQEEARENPVKQIGALTKKSIPDDFIPRDIKVVMVGDSLTEGVGDDSKKGGYLPYLKELLEKEKGINKAELINFGVRGHRTDQLLGRLEKPNVLKALGEADMVIITIGGNDMMKVVRENITNLKIEDFEREKGIFNQNLMTILSDIRTLNSSTSIVLVGLYNPFSSSFPELNEIDQVINDWNGSSQDVISQMDRAYFVEISDLFAENVNELLYSDYFHPNNKGYKLIAQEVYRTLDKDVLGELPSQLLTVNKEEFQN
jgi:lysophospholipase L1-like esterase